MLSEFSLIARYFTRPTPDAVLGIGDDAALIAPGPGCELAISTDMLVAGTHFFADADPFDLGWKTLAVNVSDMAAMGAQPRWATLALALPGDPDADNPAVGAVPPKVSFAAWLEAWSAGFFACADAFGVALIGGDTTRGPLNFCVTLIGEVPAGQALRRSGAQPGQCIWVSGAPGRAAQGLAHLQGRLALAEPARSQCLAALHRPQPRLALGLALRGIASAAIDVSDGLLADLGHVLRASGVAAQLDAVALPDWNEDFAVPPRGVEQGAVPPKLSFAQQCLLSGGDDYELLFTAPAQASEQILTLARALALPLTAIGHITAGTPGALTVRDEAGRDITPQRRGYDHFGETPVGGAARDSR